MNRLQDNGIGNVLLELRSAVGYTQSEVCRGICSDGEYGKIEANQLIPGYFELDFFFMRLGKSTEHLEYVLPSEIYELYELQYRIQTSTCHLEFEEAETMLERYEKNKYADKPIHRQYILQARAQIAWMKGEGKEIVLAYLDAAIRQTMQEYPVEEWGAKSAEELKLLLFKMEVSGEREKKEEIIFLTKMLKYIDRYITDVNEKVKVYPYAALLMEKRIDSSKEYDSFFPVLDTSLKLLRDTAKILFLPEILEIYADFLEGRQDSCERVQKFRRWKTTILELEEEGDIHLEQYRLFKHWNREFELDYEWLKSSRVAAGMSQEELCEGICTQETLSRIESGKRMPNRKKLNLLLERVGRPRSPIETVITTEKFEILELRSEYEKCLSRREIEKGNEIFEKLKRKIPKNQKDSRKYMEEQAIRRAYEEGRLSPEEGIEKLYELVRRGIPTETSIYDWRLTSVEMNILSEIGVIYWKLNQKDKAIEIHRQALENYASGKILPIFHAQEWIVHIANYATNLEDCGYLIEAEQMSVLKTKRLLECGRLAGIGKSMTVIGSVYEKQKNPLYLKYLNRAADIFEMIKKMEYYEIIKRHLMT